MTDPLEASIVRLPSEHQHALRWLGSKSGIIGKRPWSKEVVSDSTAPSVKLTAQRGIHVPAGWEYALSVALTSESKYRDGDLETQPDGTWLLLLRAHEGADGAGLSSRWNRGLHNCMLSRVPVAVFLPTGGSDYRWLGLAFIDNYDESTETFLLHGPVSASSTLEDWGMAQPLDDSPPPWFLRETSDPQMWQDTRERRPVFVVSRSSQQSFRQSLMDAYGGVCAVTQYDSGVALDAAHILPFFGRQSDTAQNGLLLRCDVHRLFDRHLIGIDTEQMTVLVSPSLESTRYSTLHGTEVRLPADARLMPSLRHLDLHRQRFDRANSLVAARA